MVALTLQQRNLLNFLLQADTPVAMAELAEQAHLSPRQVAYRLKPIKVWLAKHDIVLQTKPGVGVSLDCSTHQRQQVLRELNTQTDFQLILSAGQRQWLIALQLLTATEPLILNWFQHKTSVSRTTILKDLETIEPWLGLFELSLVRRPNYGLILEGREWAWRQALAALLWGDVPFEASLTAMRYGTGLTFSLAGNASLPIVNQSNKVVRSWDTQTAIDWVAFAEDQLGGRFTDDALLYLALALAIQAQRVKDGCRLHGSAETRTWLQARKIWGVAAEVARLMWPNLVSETLIDEITAIATHLLAGVRDNLWPGDLEIDPALTDLIDVLVAEVAAAFSMPALRHDTPLRDGLVAHIIPAYMRQRFGLWYPPIGSDKVLADSYAREYHIARELSNLVTERTGVILPASEVDVLALLIRAAFLRESTSRPKRVLIVCPSGMATAQLLVARLKARFPSLEIVGVLSLRELSVERVAGVSLLISTVPVQPPRPGLRVLQVHPLLLPEDVQQLTQALI